MFLAFLDNPHAPRLGLKELAQSLLAWAPDERDAVADWVWENRSALAAKYGSRPVRGKAGPWIFAAPVDVVAPYAVGDVTRTRALFGYLWPRVAANGMLRAYDRKRKLLPILMRNEISGIRVDTPLLQADIARYTSAFLRAEEWLRARLNASGLNLDADADVANVLAQEGIVEEWGRTATGRKAMGKESLKPEQFSDPRVASALGYRNRLKTCLTMFMEPWAKQAAARGGYISTNWNQTRGTDGGARTGRMSTSRPNLLNISKDFEGRSDGYIHPEFLDVPHLPLCRKYLLADEGHVWLHRDFSNQEVRVFAHFEQGSMYEQYRANPALKVHAWLADEIERVTGRRLEKTRVKNVTFARLYGGGIGAVEKQARCSSRAEAQDIAAFHDRAMPGRKLLVGEIQRCVNHCVPIRTWGGRLYSTEKHPLGYDCSYKLINYLIQGSSADLTEEAIIAWDAANSKLPEADRARFLVTVYDEINISAPAALAEKHMALLRDCMDADRLEVPMRSEGKKGVSWGDLKAC
jgi:DNA polymerase I-like protein with 3'-5' exonuclease and polymerase domains